MSKNSINNIYNIFMSSLLFEQLNKNVIDAIALRLYDGFIVIQTCTFKFYEEYQKSCIVNKNMKPLTESEIFIKFLDGMKTLTDDKKKKYYDKIKKESGMDDYFDELIQACLKSNYEFYAKKELNSNMKYDISNFINDCYLKCIEYFERIPELFIKKNKKLEILTLIEKSVSNVIFNTVMTKDILSEYVESKTNIPFYKKEEIIYDSPIVFEKNITPDYYNKYSEIVNENTVTHNEELQKAIDVMDFEQKYEINLSQEENTEEKKNTEKSISFLDNSAFGGKIKDEAEHDFPTYISNKSITKKIVAEQNDAIDNLFYENIDT